MSAHASVGPLGGADAYFSPGRTLVVIDPSPRQRDDLAKLAISAFRVSDFPDVESAVARVTKAPSAILVGAGVTGDARTPPIKRLRKHPSFGRTPIIRFGASPAASGPAALADQVPDAEIRLPVSSPELIRLISTLANKTVEEDWAKLPDGPRAALGQTLSLFNGVTDLVGQGKPIEFKTVSDACSPVLDTVRQSGHAYIFEGLRNHNDIWYVHSLRVATLLALFGHRIGLDEGSLMTLAEAGLVHDFGKTAYPPHLSGKMGALSPEERAAAHDGHVHDTVKYLRQHTDAPRAVILVAEQHHERLDGSGYPNRLKNGEINDLARMAAIVDVFSALTERRPYRAAMAPAQALEVMQELMRDKLDLQMVRIFRNLVVETA